MVFPPALSKLLVADGSISGAIASAFAAVPGSGVLNRMAITLVAVDENPTRFRSGGKNEAQTHYSASLLKVAALYAAFQLRQAVNLVSHVPLLDANPAALWARLQATFDPVIALAVPRISSDPGVLALPFPQQALTPDYAAMFEATPVFGAGHDVKFAQAYRAALEGMIIPGNNSDAATSIRTQGYKWIDGLLTLAGLFREPAGEGMWLAGTYQGGLPAIRVPSLNDGPSAQATTTVDMANLYAHFVLKTELDSHGSPIADEILDILFRAAHGPEPSWMKHDRDMGLIGLSTAFDITHTKIGEGALKPENGGFEVLSEATVIKHIATGRRLIVSWQNVPNTTQNINLVSLIVEQAMKRLLGLP